MSQVLHSIGAAFYPLRRADDVAELMKAAARVPASTPLILRDAPLASRRIPGIHVFSRYLHRSTAYEVSALLLDSKTHAPNGRLQQVVSTIPIGDMQVIELKITRHLPNPSYFVESHVSIKIARIIFHFICAHNSNRTWYRQRTIVLRALTSALNCPPWP